MSEINPGYEAQLLSRLDQLSDEEVTSLLAGMLVKQEETAAMRATAAPAALTGSAARAVAADAADTSKPDEPGDAHTVAARRNGGGKEEQLLSNIDQLSDEEVASLLGEMLAGEAGGHSRVMTVTGASPMAASTGEREDGRAGRGGEALLSELDEQSIGRLSDDEVTSLLCELLAGKEEAR